jgi:hypothetical protein
MYRAGLDFVPILRGGDLRTAVGEAQQLNDRSPTAVHVDDIDSAMKDGLESLLYVEARGSRIASILQSERERT